MGLPVNVSVVAPIFTLKEAALNLTEVSVDQTPEVARIVAKVENIGDANAQIGLRNDMRMVHAFCRIFDELQHGHRHQRWELDDACSRRKASAYVGSVAPCRMDRRS